MRVSLSSEESSKALPLLFVVFFCPSKVHWMDGVAFFQPIVIGGLLTSSIWRNWSSHRFFVMIVFIGISCARFMNNQRWTLFLSLSPLVFSLCGLSFTWSVVPNSIHTPQRDKTRERQFAWPARLYYSISVGFCFNSTSAGCCRTFSNGF